MKNCYVWYLLNIQLLLWVIVLLQVTHAFFHLQWLIVEFTAQLYHPKVSGAQTLNKKHLWNTLVPALICFRQRIPSGVLQKHLRTAPGFPRNMVTAGLSALDSIPTGIVKRVWSSFSLRLPPPLSTANVKMNTFLFLWSNGPVHYILIILNLH